MRWGVVRTHRRGDASTLLYLGVVVLSRHRLRGSRSDTRFAEITVYPHLGDGGRGCHFDPKLPVSGSRQLFANFFISTWMAYLLVGIEPRRLRAW